MAYNLDQGTHYGWFHRQLVARPEDTFLPFQAPAPTGGFDHQVEYAPVREILQLVESTLSLSETYQVDRRVIQSISCISFMFNAGVLPLNASRRGAPWRVLLP